MFPDVLQGKDPSLVALVRETIDEIHRSPEDLETWLRLGFVYEANGLDSLALETYDRALAVADTSARTWYRVFAVCRRQGDLARATKASSRLLTLAADYAPLHIRTGFWHLDLQRRARAKSAFQRSVELDTTNPGGYWGLARVAMLEDKPEHAAELLERLLKDLPHDHPYSYQLLGSAYRRLGRWQEAEIALETGKTGGRVWPDPWEQEVHAYETGLQVEVERARELIARGAPQLALVALQKLQQLHPESLIVSKTLGKLLVKTEQWDQALDVYGQAQDRHPDDANLFQSIASVYFGMGDLPRALSQLELALAIDSTLAGAHAGRGSILMQQRQLPQAAMAFQSATRLEPGDPSHFVQLGMVQCELKQWEDGLKSFRHVVAIDSTHYEGYLGLAVAARGMGNLEEAERSLLRARELKPKSSTVNTLLRTIRQHGTK